MSLSKLRSQRQDVFKASRNIAIGLPQIVVVGVQGSGKSSVLESFVKRNFLPRGEGVVTRCPIVLRLVCTPEVDQDRNGGLSEWCEFGHRPNKKWTDFTQIRDEILAETERLMGGRRGITKDPITLTLYSPQVVTLTVVDLPGIVRFAQDGEPEDIEDQILQLINEYISEPRTIILAVSAAPNDIVTSDSIRLAKLADPTGERTLGVITKLDRDDGSTLGNVLAGNVIRLKYGFVGVVNQSQEDLERGLTMEQVRQNEEALIRRRFPNLASQNGSKYLAERISCLVVGHILKQLPGLETKIDENVKENERILLTVGADDIPHKAATMSKTLFTFARRYASEFEGAGRNIYTGVQCSGARVKMVLDQHFVANLEAVDVLGSITDEQISIAILNSGAMESRFTICEAVYQDLVKTQIKRLLDPCLTCVNSVHEEMQRAVQKCLDPQITFQFPRLSESIVGAVTKFLSQRLDKVIKCLEKQVNREAAFVKTSRQDFQRDMYELLKTPDITEQNFAKHIVQKNGNWTWACTLAPTSGGEPAVETPVAEDTKITADIKNKLPSGRLQTNVFIVKELIRMYFEIVRQSLKDFVTRLLAHDMIYYAAENLAIYLIDQVHKADKIDDLIQVSADARAKRDEARKELEKLHMATKLIADVREMVDF